MVVDPPSHWQLQWQQGRQCSSESEVGTGMYRFGQWVLYSFLCLSVCTVSGLFPRLLIPPPAYTPVPSLVSAPRLVSALAYTPAPSLV